MLALLAAGCGSFDPFGGSPPRQAAVATTGTVSGRVTGGRTDETVVVYLEGADAAIQREVPLSPVRWNLESAFAGGIAVVPVGRPLEIHNQTEIHHRLFSYAKGNAFEAHLGSGQNVPIRFASPGLVRFYCSLHATEIGRLLVVSSPDFAVARRDGRYTIRHVEPGRYTVRALSDSATASGVDLSVTPDRAHIANLVLRTAREEN